MYWSSMDSPPSGNEPVKAEIGFECFPCGPCAEEANRVLNSLEGVVQTVVDPAVRRIAVHFDPTRVTLPLILSTLEPYGVKPKVVSVVSPMKGAV